MSDESTSPSISPPDFPAASSSSIRASASSASIPKARNQSKGTNSKLQTAITRKLWLKVPHKSTFSFIAYLCTMHMEIFIAMRPRLRELEPKNLHIHTIVRNWTMQSQRVSWISMIAVSWSLKATQPSYDANMADTILNWISAITASWSLKANQPGYDVNMVDTILNPLGLHSISKILPSVAIFLFFHHISKTIQLCK